MIEEVLKIALRLDASRDIEEVQRIGCFVQGMFRPLKVRIKAVEARSEILMRARSLKYTTHSKRSI